MNCAVLAGKGPAELATAEGMLNVSKAHAGVPTPPSSDPITLPVDNANHGANASGRDGRELSTLEAAKFLNSSHSHVVQEIDAGRLRCRLVGSDLRISMTDLVEYAVHARLGG
jgi:excisionase family DNA binding protein